MGCPDTVLVPCPKCGNKEGFQTKSGPNTLEVYELDEAPHEVMFDINRHAPYKCSKCGILFAVLATPFHSTPLVVEVILHELPPKP